MPRLVSFAKRVTELEKTIVELKQQLQKPVVQPAAPSWASIAGGASSAPAKRTPEQLDLINANADEVEERDVKVERIRRFAGLERQYDGPIVVTLDSIGSRNTILRAAKSLKNIETYSRVYFHADETPAQRKKSKELREECKLRNTPSIDETVPTHRHCVRDGRIVKVSLAPRNN